MSKNRYSKEAIQELLERHGINASASTLGGYGFTRDDARVTVNEYHFEDRPDLGHYSVHFVLHDLSEVEQLLFGVNDEGDADGQV